MHCSKERHQNAAAAKEKQVNCPIACQRKSGQTDYGGSRAKNQTYCAAAQGHDRSKGNSQLL